MIVPRTNVPHIGGGGRVPSGLMIRSARTRVAGKNVVGRLIPFPQTAQKVTTVPTDESGGRAAERRVIETLTGLKAGDTWTRPHHSDASRFMSTATVPSARDVIPTASQP